LNENVSIKLTDVFRRYIRILNISLHNTQLIDQSSKHSTACHGLCMKCWGMWHITTVLHQWRMLKQTVHR